MSGTLTLNGTGTNRATIDAVRDGVTIRQTCTPYRDINLGESPGFDLHDVEFDSVIYKDANDDTAPSHFDIGTLCGGHGYNRLQATAVGHGKTSADIGQVLDLAGTQYIIIGIRDADAVYMADRTTNSATEPTGTFTYVSGGVNTSNLVVTAMINRQWYPSSQNYSIALYVDDVLEAATTGTFPFTSNVKWVEHYELISYTDRVAFSEAGNDVDVDPTGFSQLANVDITHEYDTDGNYVNYYKLEITGTIGIDDLMFIQSQNTYLNDGTTRFYVPNMTAHTHETVEYNFQLIEDWPGGWSSRLGLSNTNTESSGVPAGRLVVLNDTYGMAVGYLPVRDGREDRRRGLAYRQYAQISTSGKWYPHIIDGASEQNPVVGSVYEAVSYRCPIILNAARTDSYAVRTTDQSGFFLFTDWHNKAGSDSIPVPADFSGQSFEVVESRNVTINSASTAKPVQVSVSATGDYAYLVLRFTPMNEIREWKGAVEPAEAGASGNEIRLWKGAVEPAHTPTGSVASQGIGYWPLWGVGAG